MTQIIKTSITDIPRDVKKGEKDTFGIEPFEKGLVKFIETTNTPITIALQGEWGSGKTSLMNSLKQNLSDIDGAKYHSVWLNTWEFALMKDAQSTLIDIILGLISDVTKIANIDESKAEKLGKKVMNIGGSLLKFAGKTALNKVADGVGDVVEGAMTSKDKASTISEIRDELETIIEDCITKDNKQGFIFFIDDLDRIDPPVAVELLELLKNIFTLKNCVFVLAIDYDVVIKGLEPKFGKLTASNEREFRSFFDKIIQVPFSMPVTSYKPNTFLQESLRSINYLDEKQVNDENLISKFSEISNLTVGSNPRALKRLLNSISLINCINSIKGNEDDALHSDFELLINFALVSIQIAYPPVYRMLSSHSDFDKWNEAVAVKFNLKPLDSQSIEKLNALEEFDEEWEQILFRLCENDYFLKKKALNISRLLNILKRNIEEQEETVGEVIEAIISLSSVTSLEAFDQPVIEYHKGNFLKKLRNLLIPKLKEKMPEQAQFIANRGSRVQTNAYICLGKNKQEEYIRLSSHPYEGGIRLILWHDSWVSKIEENNTFMESMEMYGQKEKLLIAEKNYNGFSDKYKGVTQTNFLDYTSKKQGCHTIETYSYLVQPNLDSFYTPEILDLLSDVIAEIHKTILAKVDIGMACWTAYKEKNKK